MRMVWSSSSIHSPESMSFSVRHSSSATMRPFFVTTFGPSAKHANVAKKEDKKERERERERERKRGERERERE
jgi:hypothetical protein